MLPFACFTSPGPIPCGATAPPCLPLPGRGRTGGVALIGLAALSAASAAAQQQAPVADAPKAPVIGKTCVTVEIAGTRAGELDCATLRIEAAARLARAQAETIRTLSTTRAGSPDVRVGVSSLSGTRLRMGGNLGSSARPSRPVPIYVNPMAPPR